MNNLECIFKMVILSIDPVFTLFNLFESGWIWYAQRDLTFQYTETSTPVLVYIITYTMWEP